jgi:hypothetical protein
MTATSSRHRPKSCPRSTSTASDRCRTRGVASRGPADWEPVCAEARKTPPKRVRGVSRNPLRPPGPLLPRLTSRSSAGRPVPKCHWPGYPSERLRAQTRKPPLRRGKAGGLAKAWCGPGDRSTRLTSRASVGRCVSKCDGPGYPSKVDGISAGDAAVWAADRGMQLIRRSMLMSALEHSPRGVPAGVAIGATIRLRPQGSRWLLAHPFARPTNASM